MPNTIRNNKEARARYDRMYRLRNREKFREKERIRHATCGRIRYENRKSKKPWSNILYAARRRAKKLGLPCNITSEWVELRWTGKCEITGLEFCIKDSHAGPFSPSIDRMIPSLGYIKENCRFILFGINMMKGASIGDFEINTIARAIVNRQLEAKDERWK